MAHPFLPRTTEPYLEPSRNLDDSVTRFLRGREVVPAGQGPRLRAGVAGSEPRPDEADPPPSAQIRATLPYRQSGAGTGSTAPTVPAPAREHGGPRVTPAVGHARSVRRVDGSEDTRPCAEPVAPAPRPLEVRIVDCASRTQPAPTIGEECDAMDEYLRQLIQIVRSRR